MSSRLAPRRLLTLLAASSVMLAACGGSGSSFSDADAPAADTWDTVDTSAVTLRVGDHDGFLRALVAASGSAEADFTIEWVDYADETKLLAGLVAGDVDVALTTDVASIFAQSTGNPLAVVGATREPDPATRLVAAAGSDIARAADLAGKRVSYQPGTRSQAVVLAALAAGDLTLADIDIVRLDPAAALAALVAGEVDVAALDGDDVAVATAGGAGIVLGDEALSTGIGHVIATTSALADPASEAAIAEFLRIVAGATAGSTAPLVPFSGVLLDDQQATARLFSDAGVIPVAIDVVTYVDVRFSKLITASLAG